MIEIGEKDLIDYLQKLEENNLFKMNLLQESQQTYEKIAKECQDTVEDKRAIILDVDNNVRLLQESRNQKMDRLAYYQNVLDSNSQHGGANAELVAGGDRKRGRSGNKAASTATGPKTGAAGKKAGE